MPANNSSTALRFTWLGLQVDQDTPNVDFTTYTRMPSRTAPPLLTQNTIIPEESDGTYVAAFEGYPGLKMGGLSFAGNMIFQHMPHWIRMGVLGGCAPTGGIGGAGSKTPYTWAAKPLTASDDLLGATWVAGQGTQTYQVPNALLNRWVVAGTAGQDQLVSIAGDFIAKDRLEIATPSPAAVPRTRRAALLANKTKVYLDNAGLSGGIAVTPLVGQVMMFSWEMLLNRNPNYYLDGLSTWSDTTRGRREIRMTIRMRFKDTTHIHDWQNAQEKLMRLELIGPPLDPLTYIAGSFQTLRIDTAGFWRAATLTAAGMVDTVDYTWQQVFDNDLSSDVQLTAITDRANTNTP